MCPLPQRWRGITPLLALGGSYLAAPACLALANEPPLQFQSGFLHQSSGHAAGSAAPALHALANEQRLAPGRYHVEVRVNLAPAGEHDIEFQQRQGQPTLNPCLAPELLFSLGLRERSLAKPELAKAPCIDLPALVEGAQVEFDSSHLRLDLSIPQAALQRDKAGSVAPDQWERGINAAFVNYQASAMHSSQRDGRSRSQQDLLLNSGLNLAGWRLRSSQSLREDGQGHRRWRHSNTYAQTDLPATWGTLTLGETYSSGEVFRSQPIKGLQLASDLGMLPDTLQSYAPVIRGVAQSRAKLEVLQNGFPIYSTYVAAGPYEIDDLSVGGGSGELEVVLTEADGQVRRFTQPYSTLSNLLRDGIWRYNLAAGRYNTANGDETPQLLQGTLARGIGWSSTLYGGVLTSDNYRANALGLGKDFGAAGALSFDVTHARSDLGTALGQVSGNSYAARYGKAFPTRTHLRFAGYRYSTEGFRDFDEAVAQRNNDHHWLGSRRSRLEASIYQQLGRSSSLSFNLSQDDYWQDQRQRRQYQFYFNTHYKGINYSLFASQSLNKTHDNDRILGLSLSFPLDFGLGSSVTLDTQHQAGRFSQRASLSGGALDNRLNYQAALANDGQQNKSAELSAGYLTPHANFGAGYFEGNEYRSLSVNASGSALVHGDGLVFSPHFGETNALIHVPDTPGAGMENATAARTNAKGYALAPHLQPYRINRLTLTTDQLEPDVEIDNGTAQAVPRRGAIVQRTFAARRVARLVLTLLNTEGKPLPFGTQVKDTQGKTLAVVGQGGQALVATEATSQVLNVRWGEQPAEQCQLSIKPASMRQQQGFYLQTLTCPATEA